MAKESSEGKFIFGFFIGGLVGATTIFLLGTKRGQKITKELSKKGAKFLDELEEKLEEWQEKGEEVIEKGEELKEKIEKKAKKLEIAAQKGLETASEKVKEVQQKTAEVSRVASSKTPQYFKGIPKKQ